jgi:hypothetical protein
VKAPAKKACCCEASSEKVRSGGKDRCQGGSQKGCARS